MKSMLVAFAAVSALALAGCGSDTADSSDTADGSASPTPTTASPTPSETATASPKPTQPAGPVVAITIEGDSATPIAEQVELKVGEKLTLSVTADRAGELHIHSTPEQMLEFAAGTNDYQVSFDKPGTVDIEEHDTAVLLVRALVR